MVSFPKAFGSLFVVRLSNAYCLRNKWDILGRIYTTLDKRGGTATAPSKKLAIDKKQSPLCVVHYSSSTKEKT